MPSISLEDPSQQKASHNSSHHPTLPLLYHYFFYAAADRHGIIPFAVDVVVQIVLKLDLNLPFTLLFLQLLLGLGTGTAVRFPVSCVPALLMLLGRLLLSGCSDRWRRDESIKAIIRKCRIGILT